VNVAGVVLVFLALVAVAVIAYRAGYLRGQDEPLEWSRAIAAERSALRIAAVLPRWRRVAGLAAYGFAGLLNCLFLGLAFLYAKRWGWAVLRRRGRSGSPSSLERSGSPNGAGSPTARPKNVCGRDRQRYSKHSKGATVRWTLHDRRHLRSGHPDEATGELWRRT